MFILELPKKTDYHQELDTIKKKGSKEYYQAIEASASAYFDAPALVQRLFYNRLKTAFFLIQNQKYNSTLDAGTGIGIFLPCLSKISLKVKAIDYSDIVKYAQFMCKKKEINNVSFQKADLNNFSEEEKFDLIVCLSVLEHIEDPEKIFTKFQQILNPKGTLVVGYPIENKLINFIRTIESSLRKNMTQKIVQDGYAKTAEFTGHISNWKKIDQALNNNFMLEEKKDLSFCFLKYYAIRKAVKKE